MINSFKLFQVFVFTRSSTFCSLTSSPLVCCSFGFFSSVIPSFFHSFVCFFLFSLLLSFFHPLIYFFLHSFLRSFISSCVFPLIVFSFLWPLMYLLSSLVHYLFPSFVPLLIRSTNSSLQFYHTDVEQNYLWCQHIPLPFCFILW